MTTHKNETSHFTNKLLAQIVLRITSSLMRLPLDQPFLEVVLSHSQALCPSIFKLN
jgi:hypothetical protein